MSPAPPSLAPVATAADLLGVASGRIFAWVALGRVRCERIDGVLYVSLDDVAELADEAEGRK